MSGATETESVRPRPLSGGLWTLFSWLRRDEHSSSDSLSSAGSDRTAASFAFLAPRHYSTASPALLPPPPPPTDSYKKRVRDRNVRRQHERDVTLHRKYGLYGFGYDASSLPSARRAATAAGSTPARDRRAASESLRAHVPGKRRAPPPPSAPSTLTRRRARKRPAPLPPTELAKENVGDSITKINSIEPMNRRSHRDERLPQNNDSATGCKPEKHSKKDAQTKETKDIKIRHEKSFLKHIFENKKRNSAIESVSVKLLPNISELDKQAAEMIEKYRLKELTRSDDPNIDLDNSETSRSSKRHTEAWICTRCLRKYNSSVITCNYCLPLNKVNDSYRDSTTTNNCSQTNISPILPNSSNKKLEDKEKLKEMLKEMKDSLPKRVKNDISKVENVEKTNVTEIKDNPQIVEAPTLRIGSTSCMNGKNLVDQSLSSKLLNKEPSTSQLVIQDKHKANATELTTINSVIITQPIVLVHTKESHVFMNKNTENQRNLDSKLPIKNDSSKIKGIETTHQINEPKPLNVISKTKYDLNTPLKISSLLNPIYVPKSTSSTNTQTTQILKQIDRAEVDSHKTSAKSVHNVLNSVMPPISLNQPSTALQHKTEDKEMTEPRNSVENKESPSNVTNLQINTDIKKSLDCGLTADINLMTGPSLREDRPSTSNECRLNQHVRRRNLINQLEKSIAKGDEHAAAEAAVKLAQLRLSCSVLSFSSQIVAETLSASCSKQQDIIKVSKLPNEVNSQKIEEETQKSSHNVIGASKADLSKHNVETAPISAQIVNNNENESLKITKTENVNVEKAIPGNTNLTKIRQEQTITESISEKNNVTQTHAPCEASTSKGVTMNKNDIEDFPILVWVEDKEATRGPVQLHVRRNALMSDLRGQAEKSLGLAARMQRWIVGRTLCSDDNTPLVTLAGPDLSAPFYLCLVESDSKATQKPQVECKINEDAGNVYNELMKLEKQALVSNAEDFECGVCMEECAPGSGVVLRECVHSFCKECLSDVVRHSEEPIVSCPAMGCRGILQEREIRGLVSPVDYEKWLARGLAAAESGTRNAFHCRTRDCTGWALCDPGVRRFPCPVCKHTNCVPCQAIHEGQSCEQHRFKVQETAVSSDASQTDEGTRTLLNTLISRGEALECPECSAIITKKWGCDWVKCSACKTEICWVTKGRRWGPAGRGDTSAGCRCGLDGKRCHPSCGYCH